MTARSWARAATCARHPEFPAGRSCVVCQQRPAGHQMSKRRHPTIQSRAWRRLRAQVLRQEPQCWLHLPGCTITATTVDHVIPRSHRPDLTFTRSNLRGACAACNYSRGNKPITTIRRTTTPPTALAFFPRHRRPRPTSLGQRGGTGCDLRFFRRGFERRPCDLRYIPDEIHRGGRVRWVIGRLSRMFGGFRLGGLCRCGRLRRVVMSGSCCWR